MEGMKRLTLIVLILLASCAPQKMEYAGRAQNAEAGAVINQNGRLIYVDGVKGWPEKILGKNVKVKGDLVRKQYTETLKDDSDLDMVIEKPKWKVAK